MFLKAFLFASEIIYNIGNDTKFRSKVLFQKPFSNHSVYLILFQKEFSIEGEGGEAFRVDPVTGWLVLDAPLDRETRDVYEFTLRVTDRG